MFSLSADLMISNDLVFDETAQYTRFFGYAECVPAIMVLSPVFPNHMYTYVLITKRKK